MRETYNKATPFVVPTAHKYVCLRTVHCTLPRLARIAGLGHTELSREFLRPPVKVTARPTPCSLPWYKCSFTVKHPEIRWNPEPEEWFCVKCGRTSDHTVRQDAEVELEAFDCQFPSAKPLTPGE
jgi:hypothetical protein